MNELAYYQDRHFAMLELQVKLAVERMALSEDVIDIIWDSRDEQYAGCDVLVVSQDLVKEIAEEHSELTVGSR